MLRKTLLLLAMFCFKIAIAQQDSADIYCQTKISLLTCGPGDELYSSFGHTAIRVQTPNFDIVFNYGTFEFEDPNFLAKFVRGKLPYFLSVERMSDFKMAYTYEKRSIYEQDLGLKCAEKQAILEALRVNAREENKFYKYDFTFDNCTTRALDILNKTVGNQFELPKSVPIPYSFRTAIHHDLDNGGFAWSKLGIDILLGARLDRKMTRAETRFLPAQLMNDLNETKIRNQPLVAARSVLLNAPERTANNKWIPSITLGSIFLLLILLNFMKSRKVRTFNNFIFRLVLFVTGTLGVLLVFMWFGTDHYMCTNNMNLIWALPTNLIACFIPFNQKTRYYFQVVFLINLLMVINWAWLPQSMNIALLPVALYLAFKSYRVYAEKSN